MNSSPPIDKATTDGISPTGATKRDETPDWQAIQDAARPIIAEIDAQAGRAVQRRGTTETRWLKDLRQFHGLYDPSVENVLTEDETRSKTFINITRPKTNAWSARLGDMLFPNDERNWGIDPTPVPELTDNARQAVTAAEELDVQAEDALEQHNEQVEAGNVPDPALAQQAGAAAADAKRLRDQYSRSQKELSEARDRARAMEREIDDQLTEARYPAKARRVIEDATKLGTGILKGPVLASKSRPKWMQVEPGGDVELPEGKVPGWQMQASDKARATYRRVDPWHFFPDPDAETIEDAEFILERHLPNKKKLRKMAKEMDFDRDTVRKMLKEGPQHNAGASSGLSYLNNLRSLENGGDGESGTTNTMTDRYVVWEWYGALEAKDIATMIRALGRTEDVERFEEDADPLETIMVRIFFADQQLLKIEEDYLLDSGEFFYSVYSFEKAEASILGGVGVPHLMSNEQSMLNSAVRMMLDNAGLAVGPQIIVDKEQIEPENGSWKMTPRKLWRWASGKSQRKEAPFTAIDIPMNQEHLASIIQLALRFTDEAVSMPLIAQGEQGAHITKTMGGMSMLFNSANVVFRRVVKNWDDDITAPTITRSYDFNMQFSDDDSIKGDMQIEARGTSVLLVREMQAEQLLNIIERFSTHPILGVAVKAYEAMRLVLQAMNINPSDVLLEREDYMEKLKALTAPPEGEEAASPEDIRAQTQLQIAQMDNDTRLQVAQSNERIAQMRMSAEAMQLAQSRELSLEQISAMFKTKELELSSKAGIEAMKVDSAERKQAAETAVEMENAREARAAGMQPGGSGGSISLGVEQ